MIAALPQTASTPTTPTAPTTPTDSTASTLASESITPNDFITLLVSQLKNQDPTQPMDPTTFVTQMVDFNSLEQLISINQDLTPATSTPSTGPNGAANQGNTTSTQL